VEKGGQKELPSFLAKGSLGGNTVLKETPTTAQTGATRVKFKEKEKREVRLFGGRGQIATEDI